MQVDNPIRQPSWDVGDLFHSDLFTGNNNANGPSTMSSGASSSSPSSSPGGNHSMSNASSPSSREATPLPTPPTISLGEQFPDHHHAALAASSSSSNLQSPDALYGFYDSDRPSTSGDAREFLTATGPKSPGFNAFGGMGMGGHAAGANPFGSFPMDDSDFNAYMTGLEEAFGITTTTTGANPAGSSPASSSSAASPQQQSQPSQPPQPGMEMMYGFNNMDLEMMSLPMSLDGAYGMPMMGMTIDGTDPSMAMGMNMNIGIDPQLVDSPAPLVAMDDDPSPKEEEEEEGEEGGLEDEDGDDEDEIEAPAPAKRGRKKKVVDAPSVTTNGSRRSARKSNADSPSPTSPTDKDKLTLTIAPVKVGGRGTALGRRGTVMSGGVSKRGAVAGSSVATSALGSSPTILGERGNTPAPTAGPAKRGRKAGTKKTQEQEAQSEPVVPPPIIAQAPLPVTSTSGLPVAPANPVSTTATHARTTSTSKSAIGPGIPHSSSGLGIVPPPLPNGQKHLTPVDLGLGKTFAFAIPMGTFNGGVAGVVPTATSSSLSQIPNTAGAANTSATNEASPNQNNTPGNRAMSEFGDDDDDDLKGGGGNGAYPADWRPSPEVFAKMSSKEKRQLRNKISARNFRVRRKEYISTLEGDIAERDRLLEAIRNELGSSRNENLALRREVENLKKVLLDGRGVNSSSQDLDHLPPPAPLPEKSAAEVLAAQAAAAAASPSGSSSSSSTPIFKPNTQKDLPTSPRNGTNSFWGGSGGMFGAGGVTAVHTTFVPAPVVVGLGTSSSPNLGAFGPSWNQPSPFAPALQENMNPLMRSAPGEERKSERQERESMKKGDAAEQQKENSFEGFADSNMFTMKNMDAYRMHLWGKMAAQYHAHHHQQQQQQPRATPPSPQLPQQQGDATANVYHPNLLQLLQLAQQQQQLVQQQALYQQQQQNQLQGLAARMGRSWFSSPSSGSTPSDTRVPLGTTTNLVALLSGKGSVLGGGAGNGGYTSASFKRHPPKSVGGADENAKATQEQQKNQLELAKKQQEQAQAAMIAVVASQTILRKMGQAFWDAFSGSSSSSSSKRIEASRSSGQQQQGRGDWDADKVRKVLDGTAVVRIVDVDELHKLEGPAAAASASVSSSVRPTPARSATTIPTTANATASSSSMTMSKLPSSSFKDESNCASPACSSWAQCSRDWCSTETLRNVSKGGSVSVPASPVVRGVAIGAGVRSKVDVKDEHSRKMTTLLEEGMKSLRL